MLGEFERPPAIASQRLGAFEDENNPNITEFAHFLSSRMRVEAPDPLDFILASELAIYDLMHGIDGFTERPIQGKLVGLDESDYSEIRLDIPKLACIAYSDRFAVEVMAKMVETGQYLVNESEQEAPEGDVITETITDMDTAHRLIFEDAKSRVLGLDWKHYGVVDEEGISKAFDIASLIALRQAAYRMPLNLMINQPSNEQSLLLEHFDSQKRQIIDECWLVLMDNEIDPECATFVRDYLFLKSPEIMIRLLADTDLDLPEVVRYLFGRGQAMPKRASVRILKFQDENQHLKKAK